MEKHIATAFPTLIGRFRLPESQGVNPELRRLILEREQNEANRVLSNVGGFHSKPDVLEWPSPAIASLRGWIIEAVNTMIASSIEMMKASGINRPFSGSLQLTAWANVSRKGNYHRLHNHPNNCWSGVYYVDAGTEAPGYPLSGVLDLLDPRPFTEMVTAPGEPYGQRIPVRAEAGTMVLFPSFLYHFVNPYMGEGERISVAFNVKAVDRPAAPAQNPMLG